MTGLTLDAGALIGFERNDRRVVALIARAREHGLQLAVPAGALGQVWRDGRRQSRLARLTGADAVEVVPLDDRAAREAGQLCGARRTTDVIDASVVMCARHRGHAIVTSDARDIRALDPRAAVIAL